MKKLFITSILASFVFITFSQNNPLKTILSYNQKNDFLDTRKTSNKIQNSPKQNLRSSTYTSTLDSTTYWGWDSIAGIWAYNHVRITNSYDSNNNRINSLHRHNLTGVWRNGLLIQCTYDSNNNELSSTNLDWDTILNVFVNNWQSLSSYDSNNNPLSMTVQSWNGSSWDNSYGSINTYDVSNNLTSHMQQSWVAGSWLYSSKSKYAYDASNNLTCDSVQNWNGTSWDNAGQIAYTYDSYNNRTSELRQYWTGAVWENTTLITYIYDINNNKIQEINQIWNGSIWESYEMYEMTYDINNNMLSFTDKTWTGISWLDNYAQIYTYDINNNNLSYLTQMWDSTTTMWYNNSMMLSTYDTNKNLLSYTSQSWETSGWFNQTKMKFTYDVANNCTSDVNQNWNGISWMNYDSTSYAFSIKSFVWPGDANNDLIVDNNDLLPIGLYYSQNGNPRSNISNTWQADTCNNWGISQLNGFDIKHADCNGDGVIDDNDTSAINMNFTLSHLFTPNSDGFRLSSPNLYIVTSGSFYYPGDWVDAEVWLGTSSNPVSALYGISFDLNYNASLVQPGTESMSFNSSWLGTPGVNAIKISKADAPSSTLYAAETRINHSNASGFGKIATFRFQVKTSLPSLDSINLSISGYNANDVLGNPLSFNTLPLTIDILGIKEIENANNFSIAPNPYSDFTQINYTLSAKSDVRMDIYNALGQNIETLENTKQNAGEYKYTFSAIERGYSPGIYFIKIIIDGKITALKAIQTK